MPPTAKITPKKPNHSTPFAHNLPNRRMLLVNGPNLNLLGKREPDIYGTTTLEDIEHHLQDMLRDQHIELICIQSNSENELIDAIQYHGLLADTPKQVDAIIINPAAFTHTSVALRDALLATSKPFIEVHLSNIHNREDFRRQSFFSDCAVGVICGLGYQGYEMAVRYFIAQYTDI